MNTHLKLYAIQLKQLTQTQTHPLHDLNAYSDPPRNMKATSFHTNEHTNIIISEPDITPGECKENLKHIHITITSQYLSSRKTTKLLTPHLMTFIHQSKHYHIICITKLAQFRANKSLLQSYLHIVNPDAYMAQCPLCLSHTHDTNHLFNCSQIPTQYNTTSMWKKFLKAAE